jgi:hypothetical protein
LAESNNSNENNGQYYYSNTYFLFGITIVYYGSQADAINQTNAIIWVYNEYNNATNYTVGEYNGITQWKIYSADSNGSSNSANVYNTNDVLSSGGTYILYPYVPDTNIQCFLEGTKILAFLDNQEKYVSIESLKRGDLIKTSRDGYKRIELIGKGTVKNPGNKERVENRLYRCTPTKYAGLKESLYITGCHSILVDSLTKKQREDTIKQLGKIFVTDKKYRLMACVDDKSEPFESEGVFNIWHLALEHSDVKMNYGIYANGLLVESCSLNRLKHKSILKLI